MHEYEQSPHRSILLLKTRSVELMLTGHQYPDQSLSMQPVLAIFSSVEAFKLVYQVPLTHLWPSPTRVL